MTKTLRDDIAQIIDDEAEWGPGDDPDTIIARMGWGEGRNISSTPTETSHSASSIDQVTRTTREGRTMNIETTPKPVKISLFWSWILLFLPSLAFWFDYKGRQTRVEDGTLILTTGSLSKTHKSVDLFRVKNISAEESPLSAGKITVTSSEGVDTIPYVKDVEQTSRQLRQLVNEAREKHGVAARDDV